MIHHSVDGSESSRRKVWTTSGLWRAWSRKVMGLCACLLTVVGGRVMAQQPPAYLPPVGSGLSEIRSTLPAVAGTQPATPLPAPAQPPVTDPSKAPTLNPPRPLMPYGGPGVRLPNLLGGAGVQGSVPHPTPEMIKEYGRYIERIQGPTNTLTLILCQSEIVKLKDVPKRIQVVDDSVVD
jgi:hypothetical protein